MLWGPEQHPVEWVLTAEKHFPLPKREVFVSTGGTRGASLHSQHRTGELCFLPLTFGLLCAVIPWGSRGKQCLRHVDPEDEQALILLVTREMVPEKGTDGSVFGGCRGALRSLAGDALGYCPTTAGIWDCSAFTVHLMRRPAGCRK